MSHLVPAKSLSSSQNYSQGDENKNQAESSGGNPQSPPPARGQKRWGKTSSASRFSEHRASGGNKHKPLPLTHLFAGFLLVASNAMPSSSGSCPSSLTACEAEIKLNKVEERGRARVVLRNASPAHKVSALLAQSHAGSAT